MVRIPSPKPLHSLITTGHTCHAVGENLLVVGGMQTTDTGGNVRNCSVSSLFPTNLKFHP